MYKIINITPFQPKENYFLNKLTDVSILIKTLERKCHLINLLNSLRLYKFNGPILIADDSTVPYKTEILNIFGDLDIKYFVMPFDEGTSAGRNLMLENITTPFFVLCDDDFIFEPRTRIPRMKEMLIKNNLDILGGVFFEYLPKTKWEFRRRRLFQFLLKYNYILPPNTFYEYYGNYTINSGVCTLSKVPYIQPLTVCDFTHNFFIASTEKIKSIGGWNPILKGGEHQNFFIRAKMKGLKVATTRDCGVLHDRWTKNSQKYIDLRLRGKDYQKFALQEFGIIKVENYEEVTGGKFAE